MKDIVFVSGHKNPDSDSICSAIAYADFLFKIGRYNAAVSYTHLDVYKRQICYGVLRKLIIQLEL